MVASIYHLIAHAFPSARFGLGGNVELRNDGSGQRIVRWLTAELGTEPAFDAATGTYPALEAFRATVEAAIAARLAEEQADATERLAIRAILTAMKNGTGTAGERIARLERVLFAVAKKVLA